MDRDKTYQGQCCGDCLQLITNGDTPGNLSEGQVAEWLARIEEMLQGVEHVTPGHFCEDEGLFARCAHAGERCPDEHSCDCGDYGLRTTECDHCGTGVHGDRYAVTFWMK